MLSPVIRFLPARGALSRFTVVMGRTKGALHVGVGGALGKGHRELPRAAQELWTSASVSVPCAEVLTALPQAPPSKSSSHPCTGVSAVVRAS
ncbi:MAG: hypothetical protein IPI43_34505 [Sandaracinaceae bacterium]|nr:hypothetical protein [Sandaracinaceae bacterium]